MSLLWQVHSDDEEEARHNGIHRFFVGKNAKVLYKEKHLGTGKGAGAKRIDPVTDATLDENAYMEMDTSQLGGVTSTSRTTNAKLGAGAKLVIRERLLTDGDERAKSVFNVSLDGDGSAADLPAPLQGEIPIRNISRSSRATAAAQVTPNVTLSLRKTAV